MAWHEQVSTVGLPVLTEQRRRCCQRPRPRWRAGLTVLFDGLNTFHDVWHGAQRRRRTVHQPQAPTRKAVDELVRAEKRTNPGLSLRLCCEESGTLGIGEQQAPAVVGYRPEDDGRYRADRTAPGRQQHVRRVDQIGVDVGGGQRMRFAIDGLVLEYGSSSRGPQAEADDDAVDCGLAAGLVAPAKRAVGAATAHALRK